MDETTAKIRAALAPCRLGEWPTPLEAAPALANALGLDELWIKREDRSSPRGGGNKTRALEFLLSGRAPGRSIGGGFLHHLFGAGRGVDDIVYLNGGASGIGGGLIVHGVAMRPASPAGVGRIGHRLVFLLPGNPVSCLSAYDFFAGAQQRGITVGVIYAPEEAMEDEHFRARGFPVAVEHPELGATFTYPGAPYVFEKTPWRISRRAPRLGEHNQEVFGEIGFSTAEIDTLRGPER